MHRGEEGAWYNGRIGEAFEVVNDSPYDTHGILVDGEERMVLRKRCEPAKAITERFVRVTGFGRDYAWYARRVGEVFPVVEEEMEEGDKVYRVWVDGEVKGIMKWYCEEEIKEETKMTNALTKKIIRFKDSRAHNFWYADKIGELFEVLGESECSYQVRIGGGRSRFIDKVDAEVVYEPNLTKPSESKSGKIRIRVTGYSNREHNWYFDRVGEIFTVKKDEGVRYSIEELDGALYRAINKEHCEVVDEDITLSETEDIANTFKRGYDKGFNDAMTEVLR